jgi:ribonuclease HII
MIAGVDEAGRGPLAGPVVAAAVILPARHGIRGIDDSKLLDRGTRERLALAIRRRCVAFGIGWADAAEIDALNILQATFLAMRRALQAMPVAASRLLIDGNRLPPLADLHASVQTIVGGDGRVNCIGAASILAKTVRDSYMNHADKVYPLYSFSDHKGYPTASHRQALEALGPCPLHRRSFAPVRVLLPQFPAWRLPA